MIVPTIIKEIKRRMDGEEDPNRFNLLSGLLSWIYAVDGTIEDLMEDEKILHDYGQIRPNILEAINQYVCYHCQTGDFLLAVLTNNLREAFARADEGNRKVLFQIISYCHNEIPGICWGTPDKVKQWIEAGEGSTPHLVAPENTKEVERQDGLGIWGATKFREERRRHDNQG